MRETNGHFTYELFIDFEEELENLLRPEGCSKTNNNNSSSNRGLRYNSDGTLDCEDVNRSALVEITQTQNLGSVRNLEISVYARHGDNLSLLSYHLSSLHTLVLDYSKIPSLRVLGDEIPSLKKLSVNGCNLTDLDGLSYVPNLSVLLASDNSILDVLPITDLPKINIVDLEQNSIRNYNSLSFLCLCTKLEHLILRGNPISLEREYRSRIFTLIPQLSSLDADPHNHKKPCRRGSLRDKRDDEDSSGQQGTCLSIPNNNNNDKEDKLIQKLISESTQAEQEQEIAPQNICRDAEDNEGFKDEGTTPRDEISSEELSNEETRLKLLSLRKSMEPTKLRNNNEVNYEMDSSLCSSIASQSTSDSGISETSSGGPRNIFPVLNKEIPSSSGTKKSVDDPQIPYNTSSTSKIIRQDSQLNGKLIQEGDIEIEDFDDN